MTADLGNALSPALTALTEKFVVAGKAVADWLREQTEDDTQTAIRNLKEMGANTSALELSYVKLQKSTAMKDLGESFFTISANTSKITDANKEIKSLEADRIANAQRLADLEITKVENAEFLRMLEENPTDYLKDMHNDGELYGNKLEQIKATQAEIQILEEEQAGIDEKIQKLDDEIDKRQEIEDFKIRELALEEQLQATTDVGEEDGATPVDDLANLTAEEKKYAKIKEASQKAILRGEKGIAAIIEESSAKQKADALKTAVQNSYAMASKAYQAMAGIPIVGPALGAAAAATAFTLGMGYHAKIQSAQYGADFVTSGPQLMMVGEGSGPERVQVTPLVDENIDGPQGGGITLNISGNVLSEEFTENTLIPQIKEGLRLGGDIGTN